MFRERGTRLRNILTTQLIAVVYSHYSVVVWLHGYGLPTEDASLPLRQTSSVVCRPMAQLTMVAMGLMTGQMMNVSLGTRTAVR